MPRKARRAKSDAGNAERPLNEAAELDRLAALDRLDEVVRLRMSRGKTHSTADLRAMIEAPAKFLVRVVVDAAVSGDADAARFLLDRVIPVSRSPALAEPVALSGSPAEKADQVAALFEAGKLTIEEAEALLSTISTTQQIRHGGELVDRLAALERQLAALGQPGRGEVIDATVEEAARSLPAPKAKDDCDAF
jgi:hypothetical protein